MNSMEQKICIHMHENEEKGEVSADKAQICNVNASFVAVCG